MASNSHQIDFDGKPVYVPDWALDDSVQTLVGVSQSMLNILTRQYGSVSKTEQLIAQGNKVSDKITQSMDKVAAASRSNVRRTTDIENETKNILTAFTGNKSSFVAMADAVDNLTGLSANMGSKLDEMKTHISDANMSFIDYSDMIIRNKDVLSKFGNDIFEGSRNFSSLSKSIQESIGDYKSFGISIDELNQAVLNEIGIKQRAGETQSEIAQHLSSNFNNTIKEFAALSIATDTTISELIAASTKIRTSPEILAFIESGSKESQRLEELLPGLTAIFGSLGSVGNELLNSIVTSIATNTDVMSVENNKVAEILNSGGIEVADSFATISEYIKNSLTILPSDQLLSNVSAGLGIFGEELRSNIQSLKSAAEAGDDSASTLLNIAKSTDGLSQDFSRFSMILDNTRDSISDMFNKTETPDQEVSRGMLETFKHFISRQLPGPDNKYREDLKVEGLKDEISKFVIRFHRMLDNREQLKEIKAYSAILQKTLDTIGSAFAGLMRGDLSSMIRSLTSMIERTLDRLLGGIPFLGPAVTAFSGAISFGIGTVVGATEEYARILQGLVGVGGGLGSSLESLRNKAGMLGLDLQSLSNVITTNSRAMLKFGSSVSVGSERFMDIAATIKQNTESMNQYGYSNTELLEIIAEESELRRISGQSINDLHVSMNDLLFQTTAIANLTGIQRRELLRERQRQAQEGLFSNYLSTLDNEAAEKLNLVISTMSTVMPKQFVDALRDSISAGVDIRTMSNYHEFARLLPQEIRNQFLDMAEIVRSGYNDSNIITDQLIANILAMGGQIVQSFDEYSKTDSGRSLRLLAGPAGLSELNLLFTEMQKMRGLPTNISDALATYESTRANIADKAELKLASTIEDLSNTLKTSALITAMSVFGFNTVDILGAITKIDDVFKGPDNTILGLGNALERLVIGMPGDQEDTLSIILRELLDTITGERGLTASIFALSSAVTSLYLASKILPGLAAAAGGGMSALLGSRLVKSAGNVASKIPGAGFFKRIPKAGLIAGAAITGKAAYDIYDTLTDEEKDRNTKITETSGLVGSTAGSLAGMYGGAKVGAWLGSFMLGPGPGTLAGSILGGAIGHFGGEYIGEWIGGLFTDDNISGGTNTADIKGGAGFDTIGTTINSVTDMANEISVTNNKLDNILLKHKEEIEEVKSQNQILINMMTSIAETNRILEGYVRVYKENL